VLDDSVLDRGQLQLVEDSGARSNGASLVRSPFRLVPPADQWDPGTPVLGDGR
jgi:hypothetical protein